MPNSLPPLSEPIPKFLARRRIEALGGIGAVADRLGMPERVVLLLLLSERPLPAWVRDELFLKPRAPEPDSELDSETEDLFPEAQWDDVAHFPVRRVNSPNRS